MTDMVANSETTGRALRDPDPLRIPREGQGPGGAAGGSSPSGEGRRPVVIVAGEASGDSAGARLAAALRRKRPTLTLEGIGGRRMAAAGVELVADSSDWGAIGVADALAKMPRVWLALRRLRARLEAGQPLAIVDRKSVV